MSDLDYFTGYANLRMQRDADGVLEPIMHGDGGLQRRVADRRSMQRDLPGAL